MSPKHCVIQMVSLQTHITQMSCKRNLFSRPFIHGYLPIALGQIYGRYDPCRTHRVNQFLNPGHGVRIKSGQPVELSVVHTKSYIPILFIDQYNGGSPETCRWSNYFSLQHTIQFLFHQFSL